MAAKKNKFDFVTPEAKQKHIKEVIAFFQDERGEEIGYIAAEAILDFFFATLGEEIYQKAIKDCKKLLKERLEDLEVELSLISPGK